MRIRPAAPGDAEALTDLHLDVWDEAYAGLIAEEILRGRRDQREGRIEGWRRRIEGSEEEHFLAQDDDGALVGFTAFTTTRGQADPCLPARQLLALYVRASAYGTGLGHALLTAAIGEEPAFLWVLDGNQRAVNFYRRHGFEFDGSTKDGPVGVERRMVRRQQGRSQRAS
ncbi:GNAT family N-acetyltransferase [Nesterenkonia flava]|uniref:GNAT family N-acetyltransferase n=1 Tax=Nesterenkonia flava TaxID=469799 RepID=A0ABU1FS59_9MICC|nr:GNAT family N-acetyltransferase [Nesterenkonia flava]MDR5711508.1 GNAT family N-acetyltransferase [Nesterenkonia flava]